MACASNCPTQDHASYGECLRAKNVGDYRLGGYRDGGRDSTFDRKFQAETDYFGQARRDGLNPTAVNRRAVDQAYKQAEKG